jgi:hypothetical protein
MEMQHPPPLAYSKCVNVFYEQRLQKLNRTNIHLFKTRHMEQDVYWEQPEHYLELEGVFFFGGIDKCSQALNDIYVLHVGS